MVPGLVSITAVGVVINVVLVVSVGELVFVLVVRGGRGVVGGVPELPLSAVSEPRFCS